MIRQENIGTWTDALASAAPIPGGGGASALAGALAASLGQMVANLTVGKKRYAEVEGKMQEALVILAGFQADLLSLADRDAEVFAPLAEAYRLPSATEEEKAEKELVMEGLLLDASLAPISVMEKTLKVLDILDFLGEKGSRMAVSDVGVAAQMARAALNGAVMNVYINTKSMKNRKQAEELNERAGQMIADGNRKADEVYDRVARQLQGGSQV